MPPAAGKTFQNFIHSSVLMGSSKHLVGKHPALFGAPFLPCRYHRRFLGEYLHLISPSSLATPDAQASSRAPPPGLRLCHVRAYSPTSLARAVLPGTLEEAKTNAMQLEVLRKKLEEQGISCGSCKPGQYTRMLCPKCRGGDSKERSFSLFIREDGQLAMWSCFRGKCGWRGHLQVSEDGKGYEARSGHSGNAPTYRQVSEEDLQLEDLCSEIIAWFSERMISAETLRRNDVMQRKYHNEIVIAFTYKRNGKLVNCKYRGNNKRFFQEKNTERIFYGLDDIKQATDIIIVEGEIDKLSLEEAGFRNCVSVPDGAPAQVSKNLPDEREDTKYQYLWNCKEYLEKASRIILATDSDKPGQALAEELARRLGKERCWRVTWPKKNNVEVFKDANEVLFIAK